jgi:hypothetical protein
VGAGDIATRVFVNAGKDDESGHEVEHGGTGEGGGLSTLLTGHVIKNLGYIPVFTALGFTHLTAYALMSISLRSSRLRDYGKC